VREKGTDLFAPKAKRLLVSDFIAVFDKQGSDSQTLVYGRRLTDKVTSLRSNGYLPPEFCK
jgi:hypothetical protein